MFVYLAGTCVNKKVDKKISKKARRLFSYYHLNERNFGIDTWEYLMKRKNKVNLFLDSGAFSAWTQGLEIDIEEYINFIKSNKDFIEIYANLDVIGVGGMQPNKLTAKYTYNNQKIMEKAGLSPIPVFHYGEPESYLKYYVENYNYIALGVAGNTGTKLFPWLHRCFSNYICDNKGLPKIKVHGFAVTSLKLMLRFPWYSVDSTSWVITGRMGAIFVPRQKNNEWLYNENSQKIKISNINPSKQEKGKHFDTLTKSQQEYILQYIHEMGYKLGKSEFKYENQDYELKENEKWTEKKPKKKNLKRKVEIIKEYGLSNAYWLRDQINAQYFIELEKRMPKWPWKYKRGKQGFNL